MFPVKGNQFELQPSSSGKVVSEEANYYLIIKLIGSVLVIGGISVSIIYSIRSECQFVNPRHKQRFNVEESEVKTSQLPLLDHDGEFLNAQSWLAHRHIQAASLTENVQHLCAPQAFYIVFQFLILIIISAFFFVFALCSSKDIKETVIRLFVETIFLFTAAISTVVFVVIAGSILLKDMNLGFALSGLMSIVLLVLQSAINFYLIHSAIIDQQAAIRSAPTTKRRQLATSASTRKEDKVKARLESQLLLPPPSPPQPPSVIPSFNKINPKIESLIDSTGRESKIFGSKISAKKISSPLSG